MTLSTNEQNALKRIYEKSHGQGDAVLDHVSEDMVTIAESLHCAGYVNKVEVFGLRNRQIRTSLTDKGCRYVEGHQ